MMIMSFDFNKTIYNLFFLSPFPCNPVRAVIAPDWPFYHGCIIAIGRDCAMRAVVMGLLNHSKETFGFPISIYAPIGVENFVTAMLRINPSKQVRYIAN